MTSQREIYKAVVDLHAQSKGKEQQLASDIRATSKEADTCRQWVRSARQQRQKQAWTKLLNSMKKLNKGQNKDLKSYQKDTDVFGKAKRDLEGGGRSRR